MKFRDKDFRSLCEAESMNYKVYLNCPHQDKEWFQYFCSTINGYLFFDVFLANYAEGQGTRLNDLHFDFAVGNKSPMGRDAVIKKLKEGVDKKIIMRFTDESDARTKVYQLNGDIKPEIHEMLIHIQRRRMDNMLDSFEEVYSLGIIKSYHGVFAERYGPEIATNIIRTLTSAAPKTNVFNGKPK